MHKFVSIELFLRAVFCLGLMWIGGCARETLKPTFPTARGLQQPDRVLVHDFVVSSVDLDRTGMVGSGLDRSAAQNEEDVRVGRVLAKTLSESLVKELGHRGIEAFAAADAVRPGDTTASIRGQFQSAGPGQRTGAGFTLTGNELRTHIQVFQGRERNFRVVAESEYIMPSSLRPGLPPESVAKAVSADASRAATALADRIADYYRKQGWLK